MPLMNVPRLRALDANGDPVSGAKALFYEAGTSTPVTVYTDEALSLPHSSPVVADSEGRFPQIYFTSGATKAVINDASDVELETIDNITEPVVNGGGANGDYTQYPDGTMICTRKAFVTASGAGAVWTFPVAFISSPTVSATSLYTSAARSIGVSRTTTTATVYSWDKDGSDAVASNVDLIAIGRWK